MYKAGNIVRYKTSTVRTIHHGSRVGEIKTGVIEEAFCTFNNRPCYWIKNEKELILHGQILKGVEAK